MKKRTTLTLLFIIYFFTANSQSLHPDSKFTLNGKIIGKSSAISVILTYRGQNAKEIRDTSEIKNGNFLFEGTLSEPTRAYIVCLDISGKVIASNTPEFYIEPSIMHVKLVGNKFDQLSINGSKTQKEQDSLTSLYPQRKIDALRIKTIKLRKAIASGDNSKFTEDELALLNRERQSYQSQKKEIDYQFITSHEKSYLSPFLLDYYFASNQMNLDSAKLFFKRLDNKIQLSTYGKSVSSLIKSKDSSRPGNTAPAFEVKDINGKEISLKIFEGKSVVLLDFWASWCIPCRELNPYLLSLYNQYHLKGFEIISVSIDAKRDDWKKAVIEESAMSWYQVFDQDVNEKMLFYTYAIGPIPSFILIDKESKIIGRYFGHEKSGKEELSKRLKELFP